MTELDHPKFQDSVDANTETLKNVTTKLTNWTIKWLKKFSSDKCKVTHVVVVRITFPMIHFHWFKFAVTSKEVIIGVATDTCVKMLFLMSSDRRQSVPI